MSNEKTTTGPVVGQPTNTQLIKQLTDELEQALGILNPMVIEEFKQRYLNNPYGDLWLKLRPWLTKYTLIDGLRSEYRRNI